MNKHTKISFIKSALRIIGFIILPVHIFVGCSILIVAEILGILEEVGVDNSVVK